MQCALTAHNAPQELTQVGGGLAGRGDDVQPGVVPHLEDKTSGLTPDAAQKTNAPQVPAQLNTE